MDPRKSILSIQSHVVHGCVGNKSATFPLQLLGFNVDPLNTVHLSNHTGYPIFTGQRLSGDELKNIIHGLQSNGFLGSYSHLLTGYVGSVGALEQIAKLVESMRSINSEIFIIVDPVMGDEGHLYVDSEFIQRYRNNILKNADLIVPNGFEAELLTGMTLTTESIVESFNILHSLGPGIVIITSIEWNGHLFLYGSIKDSFIFKIEIPKIEIHFTGTGDLFGALLVGRIGNDRSADNVRQSCEQSVGIIQRILKRTEEGGQRELDIVGSMHDILNGNSDFTSEIVDNP